MLAAVFLDGRVSWSPAPDPAPGRGELLVEVEAAGINGADLLQKAGRYPPPPGVPADLGGIECAGTVVALGDGVQGFALGDKVTGIVPGAGQAELAVLDQRIALGLPEGVGWPEAGGFSEIFATAHDALFTQARLAPGERLLVQGAAGGVGVAAVQLAATQGCAVVASVRDGSLRPALEARWQGRGLGVTAVAPGEVADHGPYDVVLELVGGPNLPDDLRCLATGGRIVVIGVGAGAVAEIDLRLLMGRRGQISASTLRARPLEDRAMVMRRLERHVLPLLAAGLVSVPIEATYRFGDVAAAYDRFAAGGKLGKIVLLRH